MTISLLFVCDINAAFVDVCNNSEAIEVLLEHKMGKPTGRIRRSSYVDFPEFLFNEEKLRQADEKGYLAYLKSYDKEHAGMAIIGGTCSLCNETRKFYVTLEQDKQYWAYLHGVGFLEDIFPDMKLSDRKFLKRNSICRKCWYAMLGIIAPVDK